MIKKYLYLLLATWGLLGRTVVGFAQSALPDEIRADILRSEIVKLVKGDGKGHQDNPTILKEIDQYKDLNVEIPAPILMVEAKAARATFDDLRAIEALESYMLVADKKSDEYRKAVALYPQFEDSAKQLRKAGRDKVASIPINCKPRDDDMALAKVNDPTSFYNDLMEEPHLSGLPGARAEVRYRFQLHSNNQKWNSTVDHFAANLFLVSGGFPFTQQQIIRWGSVNFPEDHRPVTTRDSPEVTVSLWVRNPPPGKYCFVTEESWNGAPVQDFNWSPTAIVMLP
jgi:hypothetical protein